MDPSARKLRGPQDDSGLANQPEQVEQQSSILLSTAQKSPLSSVVLSEAKDLWILPAAAEMHGSFGPQTAPASGRERSCEYGEHFEHIQKTRVNPWPGSSPRSLRFEIFFLTAEY